MIRHDFLMENVFVVSEKTSRVSVAFFAACQAPGQIFTLRGLEPFAFRS
jgi:hypothetical protein